MSCNVANDYIFLCSAQDAWGIVVETLAAAGVVFTIALMLALLIMVPRICDSAKRALVPIQFIFLIGTFGIFGLTFAFIIRLNRQTCPTRFFLFGVLFAICFSCLLVHASKLVRLVRGGLGMSWWVMLLTVVALSFVQIIIAILYVAIYLGRNMDQCDLNQANLSARNIDFVLILIYVLVLMALTFLISMISMCGPCKYWKRHSAHIYVTMFFSIGIWVAWISMLLRGNISLGTAPAWDDPVRAIALVANGWVFLILYMVPELCLMTRHQPDCAKQINQSQPHLLRQTVGVDNRVFSQEDLSQGMFSYIIYIYIYISFNAVYRRYLIQILPSKECLVTRGMEESREGAWLLCLLPRFTAAVSFYCVVNNMMVMWISAGQNTGSAWTAKSTTNILKRKMQSFHTLTEPLQHHSFKYTH